jgi:hypothetical protein
MKCASGSAVRGAQQVDRHAHRSADAAFIYMHLERAQIRRLADRRHHLVAMGDGAARGIQRDDEAARIRLEPFDRGGDIAAHGLGDRTAPGEHDATRLFAYRQLLRRRRHSVGWRQLIPGDQQRRKAKAQEFHA